MLHYTGHSGSSHLTDRIRIDKASKKSGDKLEDRGFGDKQELENREPREHGMCSKQQCSSVAV